jgi:uncharacterized protein Smg (DUF494 family)
MANQQLVDYLKEQLKIGISRDNLKQTLLNVGWNSSDIDDAFKAIDNENLNKSVEEPKIQETNLVNLKELSQNKDFSKEKPQDTPKYISKESFISQSEPVFEIKSDTKTPPSNQTTFSKTNLNTSELQSQPQQIKIETLPPHHKKFKVVIYILFGLVIVGFLVLIFFLYQRNSNLENQLNTLISQKGDLENKSQGINQTMSEIQKQVTSLKEENKNLTSEKLDLLGQLLLFSQSTSSLDVELSGHLLLEKGQYILKTSQNILVAIKNSKDEKVKTVLNSFVDKDIKLKGTRTPGLREIIITDINNQQIDNLYQSILESQPQTSTSTINSTSTLPNIQP